MTPASLMIATVEHCTYDLINLLQVCLKKLIFVMVALTTKLDQNNEKLLCVGN